jgi:hypothetical protein
MAGQIKIEGIGALKTKLSGLTDAMRGKAAVSAFRHAARPLIAAIKAKTPRESGALRRSVGIKTLRQKGQYKNSPAIWVGYRIGPKFGSKKNSDQAKKAWVIDQAKIKGGKPYGKRQGSGAIQAAFNMTKATVNGRIADGYKKIVDRWVKTGRI